MTSAGVPMPCSGLSEAARAPGLGGATAPTLAGEVGSPSGISSGAGSRSGRSAGDTGPTSGLLTTQPSPPGLAKGS